MELCTFKKAWPLTVDCCPCDVHFIQYLEERNLVGKSIFHFGTGEHHLVGKNNYERGNPNEVLALTACREEHDIYIDYIVRNPLAANYYKVLFGDIHTLSPRLLPAFDLVTLFHLCETWDEQVAEYARLDGAEIVSLFLSKLNPGGRIFFFPQSHGYSGDNTDAGDIVRNVLSNNEMAVEEEYESLLICRTPF